jgi:hypothetical protein
MPWGGAPQALGVAGVVVVVLLLLVVIGFVNIIDIGVVDASFFPDGRPTYDDGPVRIASFRVIDSYPPHSGRDRRSSLRWNTFGNASADKFPEWSRPKEFSKIL